MQCKIRFFFSARQVREHDYNTFLNAFRFDQNQIPDTAIKRYVDALQLEVETAEGDLRPPYLIPEIRRHLRQLAKRWPHAAFCCDLGTPFLSHYALCQWDNLRVLERGESQQVLIAYMVRDLYRFCKQGNAQIRAAGRRSGMSRDHNPPGNRLYPLCAAGVRARNPSSPTRVIQENPPPRQDKGKGRLRPWFHHAARLRCASQSLK